MPCTCEVERPTPYCFDALEMSLATPSPPQESNACESLFINSGTIAFAFLPLVGGFPIGFLLLRPWGAHPSSCRLVPALSFLATLAFLLLHPIRIAVPLAYSCLSLVYLTNLSSCVDAA